MKTLNIFELQAKTAQSLMERDERILINSQKRYASICEDLPKIIDKAVSEGKYSCAIYTYKSFSDKKHWWYLRPCNPSANWEILTNLKENLLLREVKSTIYYKFNYEWVKKTEVAESDSPHLLINPSMEISTEIKTNVYYWELHISWN